MPAENNPELETAHMSGDFVRAIASHVLAKAFVGHRLLRLQWAKKIYRYRRTQGERPFAEIKQTMGFRRFAARGRANIRGEWNLVCAAANALTIQRVGDSGSVFRKSDNEPSVKFATAGGLLPHAG